MTVGASAVRVVRSRRHNATSKASAVAINARLPGSGTTLTGVTVVAIEKFVTEISPSKLIFARAANPSVRSVVSVGMVPAASENMLKANVLPELDVPSGVFTAGPKNLISNTRLEPNVKP